jgi:hydroxypyruvate isomerase
LFNSFKEEGYSGYFGAEYQPTGHTEDTLEWMRDFQV